MKNLNPLAVSKKIFMVLFVFNVLTGCSNYLIKSQTDNTNPEFVFEDQSWEPTSSDSILTMSLPVITEISANNISSVKISSGGYEIKAPYYNVAGNPYWYEIINYRINLFWTIEEKSNYRGQSVRVAVTLRNNL